MKKLLAGFALIALACSLAFYGCGNDKITSAGSVRLVSDGKQYEPYSNFVNSYSQDVFADGMPKQPQDVINELSAIHIASGARVAINGKTKQPPVYTLYSEQFQEVYFQQDGFALPHEPGKYILCVDVTWGKEGEKEYAGYQYFFLINK